MIFIAWNCRGVKSGGTRRHARELLKRPDVSALCYLETKSKVADCLLRMADKLGFGSSFMVDPLGFAGGLLLIWNKDRVPLSWGVGEIIPSSVDRFLEGMNDCRLMDLEGKGHILPCTRSDHHPIQFLSEAATPPPRNERPFRFEAAWLLRDDYWDTWKQAWDPLGDNISGAIDRVGKLSKDWNLKTFGNIFHRKKMILARIAGIQASPNYGSNRTLMNLEIRLVDELNNILKQEEVFWYQKSRKDWIQDGDKNTTFYHKATLIRRNRSRITMLKIDGEWISNPQIIKDHIANYFKCLFGRALDGSIETPTLMCGRSMSNRQSQYLNRYASLDEVRHAVFGMKQFGSPRPDGIQAAFYQQYWDTVGIPVTDFVNSCLSSGTIPVGMLEAYMTLIPKKDNPENAGDFRPITLLNVIFKIVSKVLVNRFRPIMKKLVGPFQNSFLPGRSTMDNIVLAQEVIHNLNKSKGKKGFMVLKLDIHKAYDSLDWGFLESVLTNLNLPARLVSLILFSLKESTISVNWNGGKLPPFGVGRGVRQGDPLAPYLFILAMETLSWAIQNEVNKGHWIPYKVARGGTNISHLFFADDLILFGEASEHQLKIILSVVDKFTRQSGLSISLNKSIIYCSPNTSDRLKRRLGEIAGIPISDNMGKYLGIPIHQKRVTNGTFDYILDQMRKRLSGWKSDSLSLAGRRILTQSALATIPIYTMQALSLPKVPGHASWAWKSIIKGRKIVVSNAAWKVGNGNSINMWTDWSWDVPKLQEILPETLINTIRAVPIPFDGTTKDAIGWAGSDSGKFSTKSAYSCLAGTDEINKDWMWLWKLKCWEKIKVFIWLILKGRLLTNAERFRRHLADSGRCPCCDLEEESLKHLFWDCSAIQTTWHLTDTPTCFGFPVHWSIEHWIETNCSIKQDHSWPSRFAFTLWSRWKNRNAWTFQNQKVTPLASVLWVNDRVKELATVTTPGTVKHASADWVQWFPPRQGWYKLNTDGDVKGNSGLASAGGLVRDDRGTLVWGFTAKIGITDSFAAELWGLREGLRLCLKRGVRQVMVEMDSKSIIDLLHKDAQLEDTGCTLLFDCMAMIPKFEGIRFKHIFREGNTCADFLANLAQGKDWGTWVFTEAMDGLVPLLVRDKGGFSTRRVR
ncbi:PREDICTED: uncharacterized protein LOC109158583 [Ipomoea nil]|uniref:uncharacterized protein LOC109158583 n=1 Tax=Ipomoea nil TaxID=35883 RepID=UPI000901F412|nr:PREDICTED: uncharacterized protein LOC109158583 [Ipomoea nil]